VKNSGDKLDLSRPNPLDIIIDYRRFLVAIIAVISVILGYYALQMKTDPSLKTGIDPTSKAYHRNHRFIKTFGNEEFTLVVIKTEDGIFNTKTLDMVDTLTRALEQVDGVSEVISLTNLRIFQERNGSFGNLPLFERVQGKILPGDKKSLEDIRRSLPMTNLLVSADLKTIGIAIKVKEKIKYESTVYENIVSVVNQELKGISVPRLSDQS